jgi:hypothetical protein
MSENSTPDRDIHGRFISNAKSEERKKFLADNNHRLTPNQILKLDNLIRRREKESPRSETEFRDDIEADQALHDAKFGHATDTTALPSEDSNR